MSIAPPDSTLSHDVPDPIELLIKEAQRASRRRRLRNGLVLGAVLLFVVGAIAYQIERGRSITPHIRTGAPKGSQAVAPECSLRQLSVTSNGQVGAGGTDGGVLLFRNVSSHACSLTGYPNVVAIGKSNATITASDSPNDMLGGWDWTGNSPAPKPPIVVLANKNEVASDWYQYSENGPAGYTLFHANILRVGLSGSRSVVQVNGSVDAAEGKMLVTPFVRGKSGTAEPRAKSSN
jgi:hypothetical protein